MTNPNLTPEKLESQLLAHTIALRYILTTIPSIAADLKQSLPKQEASIKSLREAGTLNITDAQAADIIRHLEMLGS